jgi:outer membrane protein assembly factor BamB
MKNTSPLPGMALAVAGTAALASAAALGAASRASEALRNWPQWRGPLGTGEAPHGAPPLEWAEARNVRWKVELPGRGKSTPVIWRDRILLTTAVPKGDAQEFVVMAVGRDDGGLRWSRRVRAEAPHEGTHADGSYAGGSVATDGERVYAYFGSRGLYALDLEGRPLWEKQLGRMRTRNAFGEGASPALHADTLVVNWDNEDADFILALDARTGRERWRRERDEPTTWATPHVVEQGGRAQVVVGGTNRVRSYDLLTGEQLWEAPGLTMNVIPSPVSADGLVYAMSGFRGNALRAVRLADARGVLTGPPGLAWSYERDTPYVPSPLLYRGALYFLKSNSGVLTCLDARSGEPRYTQRLDAVPNVYASPVAADGRIYVLGRDGGAVVLAEGAQPRVLATNRLEDGFDASPAIVGEELYLRGIRHLYRISR